MANHPFLDDWSPLVAEVGVYNQRLANLRCTGGETNTVRAASQPHNFDSSSRRALVHLRNLKHNAAIKGPDAVRFRNYAAAENEFGRVESLLDGRTITTAGGQQARECNEGDNGQQTLH